jgi:hypothetical protein
MKNNIKLISFWVITTATLFSCQRDNLKDLIPNDSDAG